MTRFLNELRHRRVLRAAAPYALISAGLVEVTDIVVGPLGLPEGLLVGAIILALAGFPLVMVLAWFFDLTPEGLVRGTPPESDRIQRRGLPFLSWGLVVLLGGVAAYLGYRLYEETGEASARGAAAPNAFKHGKSIAVLPFQSLVAEGEPDTTYFSDGVAEEILVALSRIEGLRVAARTSAFSFRNTGDVRTVGDALQVSVVLEGSVRRAGDLLKVSAKLVETGTGFQMWSEAFEYRLEDVFRIQEEIARSIVAALELELLERDREDLVRPGTRDSEAYDHYLRGRHELQRQTPTAARRAIELFQKALARDPDFAQAYTGLADAWIVLRDVGNLPLFQATQQSHDAITKALQLNSLLPEAQISLGLCILGGGAYEGAARQFERAIELDPENAAAFMWKANLLRDQGYLSEATRSFSQALALDALNAEIQENQALLTAYQGRYERALEQLASVDQRDPGRLTSALMATRIRYLAGDLEGSQEQAKRAVRIAPDSPIAHAALAQAQARLGLMEAAATSLAAAVELAPDNEQVIRVREEFYLRSGDYEKLDRLAGARAEKIIDVPGMPGTALYFQRLAKAAAARLAVGDAGRARELMRLAIPRPDDLDPNPAAIHALAIRTRAEFATGDSVKAGRLFAAAGELAARARAEGWAESQIGYAMAAVAAAAGRRNEALEYLREAIAAGWRDPTFANHDPALEGVRADLDFRAALDQI